MNGPDRTEQLVLQPGKKGEAYDIVKSRRKRGRRKSISKRK